MCRRISKNSVYGFVTVVAVFYNYHCCGFIIIFLCFRSAQKFAHLRFCKSAEVKTATSPLLGDRYHHSKDSHLFSCVCVIPYGIRVPVTVSDDANCYT